MPDSSPFQSKLPSESSESLRATLLAFRSNLRSLRDALIQGDLEGARSSFVALQGINPSAPKAVSMSAKTIEKGACAFVALHYALEEGDLGAARKAFLGIMSSLRSHPPSRPRHQPFMLECGRVPVVAGHDRISGVFGSPLPDLDFRARRR